MELAKDCIDVGIFTNQLDPMRAFYSERIKLPYEELLPVGGGVKQYRYGLLGSVLKINHSRDSLPERVAGGYSRLIIADPRTPIPFALGDPDGNEIHLVPTGHYGVQSDRHSSRRHQRSRLRSLLWRGARRREARAQALSHRQDGAEL